MADQPTPSSIQKFFASSWKTTCGGAVYFCWEMYHEVMASLDGKPINKRAVGCAGFAYQTPGGREELEFFKNELDSKIWDQEWDAIPRANANAVFAARHIKGCIRETPGRCMVVES